MNTSNISGPRWMSLLACTIAALAMSAAAGAQAQDWHMTGLNDRPAGIPSFDNDGPGNRMGTSTCPFDMNASGDFAAQLLAYSQRGMAPYASASLGSSGWERLSAQGRVSAYAPHVRFVIQCTNPESPDVHEAFESDWFPLDYQQSTPSFECPPERPELVQAWCATAVWW